MTKLTIALALLVASCGPPKEFTATCTRSKLIGPDDVRVFENVVRVEKRGWLTSDRYLIHKSNGEVIILRGMWDVKMDETNKELIDE